jgi:hypothetical protein
MAPITVTPTLKARRIEPTAGYGLRQYPVDFHMNLTQHLACVGIGCSGGVLLGRPITHLQNFYFLSKTPDVLSMPQKSAMFWKALLTTAWFKGTMPFWVEVGGYASLYTTFYFVDEYIGPLTPGFLPPGVACGALTGLCAATVRHPYDVLRATADSPGPKKWKGPMDVFFTSLREKPQVLFGLYRGFQNAAVASMIQFAVLFGIWETLKVAVVRGYDYRVFGLAWVAVLFGHVAQYPFHYIKQALFDFNKTKRFGGLNAKQYIKEMRRTRGVTVIWTGFFKTKPLIGCVTGALTLMGYDHTKRTLHDRLTASPTTAAPLVKMQ